MHAHPMRDVLLNARVTGGCLSTHRNAAASVLAQALGSAHTVDVASCTQEKNKLRGLCGFCVPHTWTGCATHAAGGRLTLVTRRTIRLSRGGKWIARCTHHKGHKGHKALG